jgi:hypothetical protein
MLARLRGALGLAGGLNPARALQREVDLAALCVLVARRGALDEVADLPVEECAQLVQSACERQVRELLVALEQGAADAARVASQDASQDASQEARREPEREPAATRASGVSAAWPEYRPVADGEADDAVASRMALARRSVMARAGMLPRVDTSLVPEAGEGVFLEGGCEAGRVVAFYPGRVYMPFQVDRINSQFHRAHQGGRSGLREGTALRAYEDLFGLPDGTRNAHAIQRYDGVTINARWGSTAEQANYFAVGHKINHPPKGQLPNVIVCPFDFSVRLASEFPKLVPNAAHKEDGVTPSWWWMLAEKRPLAVQSMLFVALSDIAPGEELLVNYRFNPALKLPAWYHPVDVEEDQRRWASSERGR